MSACSRLSNHQNDSLKKLVYKVITKFQFSCYSQFSLASSKRINKVHECALRVILNIHASDSETLFQNNNGVCNHQ